jgi:hypothetical protein
MQGRENRGKKRNKGKGSGEGRNMENLASN